jgi:DNA polymerase elongation subunit (family B)
MASFITGSARLILAMAEVLALKNNGYIAYMDTDSIFVKPENAQAIQDFFRPLNRTQ